MDFEAIENKLKTEIKPSRFKHTQGVMYTAACLAMRYDYDVNKAMLAGLLHDCTKCFSNEEQIVYCDKKQIAYSSSEKRNPFILHQKTGAVYAKEIYGIEDEEILHAISVHTTGCTNMSLLDKIIFVSDFIEPGRTQASNLNSLRKTAFIDLDQCLIDVLKSTLDYLNTTGEEIDPTTQKVYDFYSHNERN